METLSDQMYGRNGVNDFLMDFVHQGSGGLPGDTLAQVSLILLFNAPSSILPSRHPRSISKATVSSRLVGTVPHLSL